MRGTWYDEEVGERIATGALRPRNDRDEGDGTKGAGKPSYIESTAKTEKRYCGNAEENKNTPRRRGEK